MGGWNSGRTGGQLTLEGCGSCRLSTKNLRNALRSPTGGTVWRYYRIDGELMHVTLEVRPDRGYLRLQHPSRTSSGPNHMDYTAGLTWTEVGFGGRRWWFSCPISDRRCATLYLPRGAQKFAAATTYRLAYGGLPPWKWSSLKYGFAPGGGEGNGKEAAYGRGDRRQATAG